MLDGDGKRIQLTKKVVKDKDGNILPIDIPDEFMDGLRAMLKEEQEKVKNRGRDPLK